MTPTPQQTAEAVKEIQERIDKGCFYEHDKPTFQTLLSALAAAQKERDCWLFNAKELQKQVNQMEKEIAELKRDKERLDWMENQATLAFWQGTFADSDFNAKLGRVGAPICTISTMDADGEQSEHDEIGHGQSFRDAIDSAQNKK